MNRTRRFFTALSFSIAWAGITVLPLSHATAPLHAAPGQATTIEGMVSVVETGGKKTTQLTTADGRTFVITGKLDKMIRDRYAGKSVKLSGKIDQEAAAGKPGSFRADEIAVQLN